MSIDTKRETVNLEENGACALEELPKKVPNNVPRYHVFRHRYSHEGDALNSIGEISIEKISNWRMRNGFDLISDSTNHTHASFLILILEFLLFKPWLWCDWLGTAM